MAYLGTTFDAHSVEPTTAFEVLPAGKYHVQIVKSEMRDTKGGTGQYLWMELAIMDGPHTNKRLFERLNLVNPNDKAMEIAQRTLSAICRATGQMSVTDSEQLHNRSMIATVRVRAAGPDRNGIPRDAANEISGYEPMTGRPVMAAPHVQSSIAQDVGHAEAQIQAEAARAPATPPWKRTSAA
jgi:hypothetical protein